MTIVTNINLIFPLNLNTVQETPVWIAILVFGIPFFGGAFLYFYKTRHARLWRKGIFPEKLKPKEDHFLEAYLALGARMITLDYKASKQKITFINQYFSRYFKFANYNFSDSIVFSFRHPIQTRTVTNWLKTHLPTEGGRAQVLYFLTGLATVSGQMADKELAFLKQIAQEMELKPSHLTQILSIFASYEQQKKQQTEPKVKTRSFSYEILGISADADLASVKKAYRQLVKLHHPDHFVDATTAQKKMAEEKFIEIQRAYEEICSHF